MTADGYTAARPIFQTGKNRIQLTLNKIKKITGSMIYPNDWLNQNLNPMQPPETLSLTLQAKPKLLTFSFFTFIFYFYNQRVWRQRCATYLTISHFGDVNPAASDLSWKSRRVVWGYFVSSWSNWGPEQQRPARDVTTDRYTVRLTIYIHNHCCTHAVNLVMFCVIIITYLLIQCGTIVLQYTLLHEDDHVHCLFKHCIT